MKKRWLIMSAFAAVVAVVVASGLVMGVEVFLVRVRGLSLPYHPDTADAPVLEFKWDGEFNVDEVTRYTPYGIWENLIDTPQGTAYEPAQEMQFYVKTDKEAMLAVAPGVVWTSEVYDNETGAGIVTVRYGRHYSITYYHVVPDSSLKTGQVINTGDRIGRMEKRHNPHWGEETWWEIGMAKFDPATRRIRTVPPYDYFSPASQRVFDAIAGASKERSPFLDNKTWTVTQGCSWAKYVDRPEWWANAGRLGAAPQGLIVESLDEFLNTVNASWKVANKEALIVGPEDKCRYEDISGFEN